jgi:gp16 family phage-associated protein
MTPDQVKKSLSEHGMSIRDFARTYGFGESLVYAVLAGKNKATRGESHKIAVALGLKPQPETGSSPSFVQDFYRQNWSGHGMPQQELGAPMR